MNQSSDRHPPSVPARERILQVALEQFAQKSYEEVGLRDIAGEAGIDVAYVHRCFGSKERLFTEVLRTSTQADRILGEAAADPARGLARQVFSRDGARASGEIGPLDIAIRSLSSPKAAAVLRTVILEDLIAPLSAQLGQREMQGPALVIAFLAGLGILRSVMQLPPLREDEGGRLEHRIAKAIACLLDEEENDGSWPTCPRSSPG